MSPDGSPWRVVHSLPGGRHIADYLRPDGTVYLRIPIFDFRKAETWPRKIRRVAESGEITGSFDSLGEWFRGWVRELTVGDERAFVFMESRGVVPHLVPMPQADNLHLVYLLHNMHLDRPRRWDSGSRESYARLLDGIPGMDAMVTLTERQRQDIALRRGDTENLFVVPNPVDMPAAPAPEVTRDPRRIAVVARLEPQKRLGHALRAFARVVESVPDAHFDIYGRGPLSATLAQQARELGIERSVTMHGHDPNAREALWRATALVVTSRYEGYPLAVLESMSHGCPVVSYDVSTGPGNRSATAWTASWSPGRHGGPGRAAHPAARVAGARAADEQGRHGEGEAARKGRVRRRLGRGPREDRGAEASSNPPPRRRPRRAEPDRRRSPQSGPARLRPATPPDGSRRPRPFVSRRPCASRPRAGSATSPPLGGAGCGVAGVRRGRGLPVDWTLEGSTFRVRSDVCLRDQLPPATAPRGRSG